MKIINDELDIITLNCEPDCSTDDCGMDGDDTGSCGGSWTHKKKRDRDISFLITRRKYETIKIQSCG